MQKRVVVAIVLFTVSLMIWIPSSDLVKLIVNNDEIVFGRYSRGHFGALFIVTLLLWIAAGIAIALRRKPMAECVFAVLMVYLSTGLSVFVLVIGSAFINKPRYVEEQVKTVDAEAGITLTNVVRHRPPNERYDLVQRDEPDALRSYPNAPKGYPEFPLVLTTDSRGFRNQTSLDTYDIVAVGDSFVAGSHVSDDQAWAAILQKKLGQSLYNLAVSGSDLMVYLNNFVSLGRPLKPKAVLLMIYEGNDFRAVRPLPKAVSENPASDTSTADNSDEATEQSEPTESKKLLDIAYLAKASPVTKGLKRLSAEVFSAVGKEWPVPEYTVQMGWMPLAVPTTTGVQYYSFPPKRLTYLDYSPEEFVRSTDWHNARAILDTFAALSQKDHFRLVVVYAPSAPHVVMPLAQDHIPADQLFQFVRYSNKKLKGDPETYKQQVLGRLDTQENTVMAWCAEKQVDCVSPTAALRKAAAQGQQVYYVYDQHWTPEGNAVVADVLQTFFQTTAAARPVF
jgi:hypothetical protein